MLAGVLLPASSFFAVLALILPPLRHRALVGPHLAAAGLRTHVRRRKGKPLAK